MKASAPRTVIIMGAGGRDFHNFNVVFRADATTHVAAFTATQIPGIENRVYPPSLAGPRYPQGIPIRPESELPDLIRETGADDGESLTSGIGGSRNPAALKCLHAHVAFALARPGYRLGDAVLAEVPERWPSTCCTPLPGD